MGNSDFTIYNMGATIQGSKNNDGTYSVTTQGSRIDSKPTTKIVKEKDIFNDYNLERTPQKDVFVRTTNPQDIDTQYNMGSTTHAIKNEDGSYTLITQGTKKGSAPTITTIDKEDLQNMKIKAKTQSDEQQATLDKFIAMDPFSSELGPYRFISQHAINSANTVDSMHLLEALITGDEQKKEQAMDSLNRTAMVEYPFLKYLDNDDND